MEEAEGIGRTEKKKERIKMGKCSVLVDVLTPLIFIGARLSSHEKHPMYV